MPSKDARTLLCTRARDAASSPPRTAISASRPSRKTAIEQATPTAAMRKRRGQGGEGEGPARLGTCTI